MQANTAPLGENSHCSPALRAGACVAAFQGGDASRRAPLKRKYTTVEPVPSKRRGVGPLLKGVHYAQASTVKAAGAGVLARRDLPGMKAEPDAGSRSAERGVDSLQSCN